MAESGTVILDTCALLWLVGGERKLSRSTHKEINEAAALYVSAVSGFEIALKVGDGKLRLPLAPLEWFEAATDHYGLTILPLDLRTCISAAMLPPIHDDPADRFIIATAKLNHLAVVTKDEWFEKYDLQVLS